MVTLTKFDAEALREYGKLVKSKQISRETAEKAAVNAEADIVMNGRGIIGALASLPYFANPWDSVIL